MSESPSPPKPSHPATNIARNIIVGAITTIIGSTAVFFITRGGKPKPSELELMLMRKESTINAWKSYVTFENLYTRKSLSLINDYNAQTISMDEFVSENERESNKFKSSVEDLSAKKNIDEDLVQALHSRLDNERATMPLLQKFSRFIKSMKDSNLNDPEKIRLMQEESARWVAQSKGYTDRAIADIEDIAKTLSERYGQAFSMNEFLIYNIVKRQEDSLNKLRQQPVPADTQTVKKPVTEPVKEELPTTGLLTGKWVANPPNGADIDLMKNGKMFWHVLSNGDHVSGNWKLLKGKLYLYPVNEENGKKATWIFDLSNVTANSFSMKLTVQPYNNYNMFRQKVNP